MNRPSCIHMKIVRYVALRLIILKLVSGNLFVNVERISL